jgi:tyrosyl-tRNA synthetase
MHFLDELQWRELLHQTTAEAPLREHLAGGNRIGYCGFDPTADSLTIGNLIPLTMLRHWQRCGHTPIVVMGGGTGLIGDPSGKDAERGLLSREQVEHNVARQRRIFEQLLDFDPALPNAAVLVNNLDWLGELQYLDVLRDVGKYFSVNTMMQKDSVRDRLHGREQGISYTEFSYMILQAYDFLHLRRTMNCTCQVAGSDQYGNIIEGIDLIRREFGAEAGQSYGITAPLVTKADGGKFGKSEAGAIWLTADRTSPYAFYQFWINCDDRDVLPFLRKFTMLPQDEITQLERSQHEAPHERAAHRALAEHMTATLHGEDELHRVQAATAALFTGNVRDLDAQLLGDVFADVPSSQHDRALLEGDGASLVDLLPDTSLAKSKREAREFLGNGAIAVNGEKVPDDYALTTSDLLHGRSILLRRGKKNWHATRWE